MLTYTDEGWIATLEELQQYLQWLWSHHEPLLKASSRRFLEHGVTA